MQGSGMPWPGDEGEQRWRQAWMAIKKVGLLFLRSSISYNLIFMLN